jgi:2-O-methyltransferase
MKIYLILAYNYIWNYILKRNPFWNELKFIGQFLPKNPVILEAGAHIGGDSIKMALAWKGVKIHAFEPIPDVYRKLISRTFFFKGITTYPVALGASTGQAKIFVSKGDSDASSSLLAPKEHLKTDPGVFFEEGITINTITIDEWAKVNNVTHIDFMWLDMQGYELAALMSGTNVLKTVKAIYTEIFLSELYEGAPLFDQVKAWLETQGFKVEKLEMVSQQSGNALFVRK